MSENSSELKLLSTRISHQNSSNIELADDELIANFLEEPLLVIFCWFKNFPTTYHAPHRTDRFSSQPLPPQNKAKLSRLKANNQVWGWNKNGISLLTRGTLLSMRAQMFYKKLEQFLVLFCGNKILLLVEILSSTIDEQQTSTNEAFMTKKLEAFSTRKLHNE